MIYKSMIFNLGSGHSDQLVNSLMNDNTIPWFTKKLPEDQILLIPVSESDFKRYKELTSIKFGNILEADDSHFETEDEAMIRQEHEALNIKLFGGY